MWYNNMICINITNTIITALVLNKLLYTQNVNPRTYTTMNTMFLDKF